MTKPVTLSDAAYNALLKAKRKDMSFSDAVLKLVEASNRSRNFTKLAGSLKSNSKELEEFKKLISEDRIRNIEEM
ncbi:MAG: antitoxin VapB family protein [Thermoplasmatales archaeon]|jgi:predicted CopG family antitoxin|nr:antitoxin VapB family protein [Thermoplasmatales archaeon]